MLTELLNIIQKKSTDHTRVPEFSHGIPYHTLPPAEMLSKVGPLKLLFSGSCFFGGSYRSVVTKYHRKNLEKIPPFIKSCVEKNNSLAATKMTRRPLKLSWKPNITYWQRNFIFQTSIVVFHINFPGCTFLTSEYTVVVWC